MSDKWNFVVLIKIFLYSDNILFSDGLMADFVTCANVNDVKEGEGKTVEANGKTIALFNVGGKIYAIDNTCKHAQGPLGEGTCEGVA